MNYGNYMFQGVQCLWYLRCPRCLIGRPVYQVPQKANRRLCGNRHLRLVNDRHQHVCMLPMEPLGVSDVPREWWDAAEAAYALGGRDAVTTMRLIWPTDQADD